MSICPWFQPCDSKIAPQHDHAADSSMCDSGAGVSQQITKFVFIECRGNQQCSRFKADERSARKVERSQPTGISSHIHTNKVMKDLTLMKPSLICLILSVAAAVTLQCRNLLMTLLILKWVRVSFESLQSPPTFLLSYVNFGARFTFQCDAARFERGS